MKAQRKAKKRRGMVAVALTWDGARWPVRKLPAAARAFLGSKIAPAKAVPGLLMDEKIGEIRVCWVPRLQGGDEVLAPPFSTPDGKRIRFQAVRQRRFGEVLGVVYRQRDRAG